MKHADRTLMTLSTMVMQVGRTYRAAADRFVADYGLSQASAWPMVMIGRLGEGVRPGAVAEALGLEPSSLVRVIDQLIEAGLVTRQDDPLDRRAKTLHLTDSGRDCAGKLEKALIGFRRSLFEGIAPDEAETCLRVLQQLDAAILRQAQAQGAARA